jgi:hypothetical protein
LVILLNKYVLAYAGFPYPISLTLIHMAFCASLAFGLIKAGVSDTAHMDRAMYIKCVLIRKMYSHALGFMLWDSPWCLNSTLVSLV